MRAASSESRNRLVGECRRQAQTAPPHGRHKQRIHFHLLGRSRFRVDELNSDARFPQAFHALDAVNERGESGRRCRLRPHERARTIRLKGVASAKLISQSNELAHREGFGQLDKHKFRRAYGHAGSDFEKGPTQQRAQQADGSKHASWNDARFWAAREREEGARPWRCPIALRAFASGWAFSHSRWPHEQQPRYLRHGQAS